MTARLLTCFAALLASLSAWSKADERPSYAIVVSEATAADADWAKVVKALKQQYEAETIVYEEAVGESLEQLGRLHPRYTCFVATREEAGRQFVADVHRLTRKLDDDPYTDTFWGILTGYDAAGALRNAQPAEPLVVKRVASGTEVALDKCVEGVWYCELQKNRKVARQPGEDAQQIEGPDDTTEALVDTLNDYQAQLFVTSGHATERDWQIGFRYRNGYFKSKAGQLYGQNTKGERFDIQSDNPKVYLPIGNCLMGHIDGPDAMALAWMHSAGVRQMIGYTVPTWYGYAGWGMLDYFVEQPGRYSMNEAFFANQHALIHRIDSCFPELTDADVQPGRVARFRGLQATERAKQLKLTSQDAAGLLFDRDVVAFYGDPAWQARMADGSKSWKQNLTVENGVYTLTIKPNLGEATFQPVNTNGAQRGWRPIVAFLPQRITNVEIVDGDDLQPVVADDFVLVPNPRTFDEDREYKIVFRAKKVD